MNKYLVCITEPFSNFSTLCTANELFNRMDMADCTDESVKYIYLVTEDGPKKCYFYGTWCSLSKPFDPLRMEIRDEEGNLLDAGYGTDH